MTFKALIALSVLSSTVLSGLIVGWLMDQSMGTESQMTVIGIILGSIVGFGYLVKALTDGNEDHR